MEKNIINGSFKGRNSVLGYVGKISTRSKVDISESNPHPERGCTISLGFTEGIIRTFEKAYATKIDDSGNGVVEIQDDGESVVSIYLEKGSDIVKYYSPDDSLDLFPGERVDGKLMMALVPIIASYSEELATKVAALKKKYEEVGKLDAEAELYVACDNMYWNGTASYSASTMESVSMADMQTIAQSIDGTVKTFNGYNESVANVVFNEVEEEVVVDSSPVDLSSVEGDSDAVEVVAYLKSQSITAAIIKEVLDSRSKYGHFGTSEAFRIEKGHYVGREMLENTIDSVLIDTHIILEGPKAAGKNELVNTLSWLFARPVYTISGNYQTEKAELTGEKTLSVDEDGTTRVIHDVGVVVKAMQQGGILLMDEVNMIRPEITALLNAATDDRRKLDVPGYGLVSAKPGFIAMYTMNYGYAGTADMNEATSDRPDVYHLEPDVDADTLLTMKVPHFGGKDKEKLIAVFKAFIESASNGELPTAVVSIRGLISAAKHIVRGRNAIKAIEAGLVNKAFDANDKNSAMAIVKAHYSSSRR